jgi:RNA polymerase sigma-70 factor, ECF subfamily
MALLCSGFAGRPPLQFLILSEISGKASINMLKSAEYSIIRTRWKFPFIGAAWNRPAMADNITGDPVELIVRAQSGSPEATGALYLRYNQSIYRYLYYHTSDLKTAEDLTSDVFLKMVQFLPSYRVENSAFQAWLFQIAHNIVIDHYRRTKTHPVVEIDENMESRDPDLDHKVDYYFNSLEMSRALSSLPSAQREVLLLRFIEEMPIAEAARILHKSQDSIKALQRRGLTALRNVFTSREVDGA